MDGMVLYWRNNEMLRGRNGKNKSVQQTWQVKWYRRWEYRKRSIWWLKAGTDLGWVSVTVVLLLSWFLLADPGCWTCPPHWRVRGHLSYWPHSWALLFCPPASQASNMHFFDLIRLFSLIANFGLSVTKISVLYCHHLSWEELSGIQE